MKKRCPKCGIDKELVENPPRVLRHALPQLGSPLQRDVPFTCETCGLEVYTTLSYSPTGTQDHRPGTVQGQRLTEHQLGRVRSFHGKLSPSVSYPGVLRPGENVLFPAHEGRLDYGGVIDRHGDPDLMADFAAEYLKQSRVIMPMGRLPRTVSEMMPALNLQVNAVELALKAYLIRADETARLIAATKTRLGHQLSTLYGALDPEHRDEIERRFADATPNANLKALGIENPTAESILAAYGTSFGSTVYMDTRYFATAVPQTFK